MTPPSNEIRPNPRAEADSKSFRGDAPSLPPLDDLDAIHRLWLGAYNQGFADGQRFVSVDMARDWIHAQARKHTEAAVQMATANNGAGWASEIEAAAVSP